jgi:hypothetical protein
LGRQTCILATHDLKCADAAVAFPVVAAAAAAAVLDFAFDAQVAIVENVAVAAATSAAATSQNVTYFS